MDAGLQALPNCRGIQRRGEMVRQGFDKSPIRATIDLGVERLFGRGRDPLKQMGSKHFEVGDLARPQRHMLVVHKRL